MVGFAILLMDRACVFNYSRKLVQQIKGENKKGLGGLPRDSSRKKDTP